MNLNSSSHKVELILLSSSCKRLNNVGIETDTNFSMNSMRGGVYTVCLDVSNLPNRQFMIRKIEENVENDISISYEGDGIVTFKFVSREGIKKAKWALELIWKSIL